MGYIINITSEKRLKCMELIMVNFSNKMKRKPNDVFFLWLQENEIEILKGNSVSDRQT